MTITKREDVLITAARYVTEDRAATHGLPENTFGKIAQLWSVYLGVGLADYDVAHLMVLLKVARAQQNPRHEDNHVDIAGYGACAAELAQADSL